MAVAGLRYARVSDVAERYACRELQSRPYRVRPAGRNDVSFAAGRNERSLLQADALALSLRSALDRILLPLARASSAFVRRRGWTEFGFARLDDCARERLGRSGRSLRDHAALGDALTALPDEAARALSHAIDGDDGHAPLGRVAAFLIARAALRVGPEEADLRLADWLALGRTLPIRELRKALSSEGPGRSSTPAESVASHPQGAAATDGDDIDVPPDERSLLRLPVPASVLAAFDEAVDLFRAVEGTETTVTSFVEALVA